MGVGSSGRFKAPGYWPFGEPEEVLIHLLLADEEVEGPEGRSTLSTSFRMMIGGPRPWPFAEWRQRWNLHRWKTGAAEVRFEHLMFFLHLCAEAAREGDDHVHAAGIWCAWLPGFLSRPEDTISAAGEWLKGKPWTNLLQAALGSTDERARFYRLWSGENPDLEDNSGDLLAAVRDLKPLMFTWNPSLETNADARKRLSAASNRYFVDVEANLKASPRRLKKTRSALNREHLVWLARRLILHERPVDTAQAVYRRRNPTATEIARIRAGQKSVADLIELALPRARSGPRPAL